MNKAPYCDPISGGLSNGVQSSATLPRSCAPTREERLIKFQGIGPVDETGMPIASRSVRQKHRFIWLGADTSDFVVDIFIFFLNPDVFHKVTPKICLPSALSHLFLSKSVNKPRDWYKSMFRQIHRKPEGKDAPPPPLLTNNGPSLCAIYCRGDPTNRLKLRRNKLWWKTPKACVISAY